MLVGFVKYYRFTEIPLFTWYLLVGREYTKAGFAGAEVAVDNLRRDEKPLLR